MHKSSVTVLVQHACFHTRQSFFMYNDIGDWMLVLFFLLLCFKPCLMLNKMPVSVMFDHIRTQQWHVLQQPRTNTKDLDYPFFYIFCMLIPIHAYLMKHCCMIEMLGSLSRSWHAIQQRLVVLFPSYTSRQNTWADILSKMGDMKWLALCCWDTRNNWNVGLSPPHQITFMQA